MTPLPGPDDEDRLARLLAAALRDLAPRRAPPTLESRVLARIARRQSTPWVLLSFSHWPLTARAAFFAASFTLIGIVIAGIPGMPSLEPLDHLASGAWLRPAAAAAASLQSLPASFATALALADTATASWLKIFLAAAACLYATLFGLGAAAYRLLYLPTRVARP